MVRFSMDRWLGFLLTLCLLIASSSLLSAPASAAVLAGPSFLQAPGDPASSGGSAAGDPDVPMGPGDGRSSLTWRSQGRVDVIRTQGVRPAGDVTASGSVVVDHVRLLLLSLRSLYLGF
jgi:hypothetical protein